MKREHIAGAAGLWILSLFLGSCGAEAPAEKDAALITEAVAEPTAEEAEVPEPTAVPEPTEVPEPTATPTPVRDKNISIGEIDHYVMSPMVAAYFPEDEASGQAFRDLIDAVFAHESSVKLTDDWDNNLVIWNAATESPYFFVVDEDHLANDHKTLTLTYRYGEEEAAEMLQFIDDSYIEILNGCITENMSDLEKVLSVYHYFGERISYDYEWYDSLQAMDTGNRFEAPDIAVYDALKTDSGVCHSYTYLCQFAFQQLGIECIRVSADMASGDDSHMWPIVKIDGNFYNIDPTWDSHAEDDTVGLRYFGMTHDEATTDRGIQDYEAGIDVSYGEVVCEDHRFDCLHDVTDYHMNYDGTITVYREDGSEEIIDVREL
ncbi:MAG: hypothetical protein IKI75_12765 [Lachnospiraceae bacterium]|nr:hypothetical protein [Lachnospiraceae bacterium]